MPTDPVVRTAISLLCLGVLAAGCSGAGSHDLDSDGAGSTPRVSPTNADSPSDVRARKDRRSTAPTGPGRSGGQSGGQRGASTPDGTPVTGGEDDEAASGGEVTQEDQASATTSPSLATLASRATSDAPLVRLPLPRSAHATGRMVDGLPTALRPSPGSRVTTSSVAAAPPRLQVAITASTSRSLEAVMRTYRIRFARWGLRETTGAVAAGGSQVATFVRGRNSVSVTAGGDGARTTYQVFASLLAAE